MKPVPAKIACHTTHTGKNISLPRTRRSSLRKCGGFTLLELLIAIAIFALLATACYRLLTNATQTRVATRTVWDDLTVLQRARLIMNKDFTHASPRAVRNSAGEEEGAMGADEEDTRQSRYHIVTFTRTGWRNLTGTIRSDLQRVSYYFEAGQLVRYYRQDTEPVSQQTPVRQVLATGLDQVRISFMDKQGRWLMHWPPETAAQKEQLTMLPRAVRLSFIAQKYGALVWTIPGVSPAPDKIKPATTKENDDAQDDEDADEEEQDDDSTQELSE